MRVLVAGIGNVFFGDDGFGVEAATCLVDRAGRPGAGPPGGLEVQVGEYGIRGVHLAYELLDGWDVLVLLDVLPTGQPPGTVTLLEVDPSSLTPDPSARTPLDGHAMSPATVLGLLAGLGGTVGRVLVVGCEPAVWDEGMGLSPEVAAAVPAAVDAVDVLLAELAGAVVPAGAVGSLPRGATGQGEEVP